MLDGVSAQSTGGQALDENDWRPLVNSIVRGTCTPFIGAGIAAGDLPLGPDLSQVLAEDYKYPFTDVRNLPRVAQFVASITQDNELVKSEVVNRLKVAQQEYLSSNENIPPENYELLAELSFPIYITTNYDEFLYHALERRRRTPVVEVCRWNDRLWHKLKDYQENLDPTRQAPLVYHMHGRLDDLDSVLLTEDDYIEFIVTMAHRAVIDASKGVLPRYVDDAIQERILFIGYSLEDWNFRVLLRYIMKQMATSGMDRGNKSIAIQLDPTISDPAQRGQARAFLANYLQESRVRLFFTDAGQFLRDLNQRVRKADARDQAT